MIFQKNVSSKHKLLFIINITNIYKSYSYIYTIQSLKISQQKDTAGGHFYNYKGLLLAKKG